MLLNLLLLFLYALTVFCYGRALKRIEKAEIELIEAKDCIEKDFKNHVIKILRGIEK